MVLILLALGVAVVIAVIMYVVFKKFLGSDGLADVPKDTVVLHQLARGPFAPSISPFCLKLETYLRMADIKYTNVHGRKMSRKSKVPWIELNGQNHCDTYFCIEMLNKKFDVDLDNNLSPKERSISTAFLKMTEEHLYWGVALYRWVFRLNKSWLKEGKFPVIFQWIISKLSRKQTWEQGMGRHSLDEINELLEEDLKAISVHLGENAFMMGQKPSRLDCSMFGVLAQFKWNLYGSMASTLITDKYCNLSAYCDRMRDRYWPDWEESITKGK